MGCREREGELDPQRNHSRHLMPTTAPRAPELDGVIPGSGQEAVPAHDVPGDRIHLVPVLLQAPQRVRLRRRRQVPHLCQGQGGSARAGWCVCEKSAHGRRQALHTVRTFTEPSPEAETSIFSFSSHQQQSYSPSAVSKDRTSRMGPPPGANYGPGWRVARCVSSCAAGAAPHEHRERRLTSRTYCRPLPMMPKF